MLLSLYNIQVPVQLVSSLRAPVALFHCLPALLEKGFAAPFLTSNDRSTRQGTPN